MNSVALEKKINIFIMLYLNIQCFSNFKEYNATYLIKYVKNGIIEL